MKRYYDMDWLRAIIVLSIIPFHATIIFNQDPGAIMYVKDTVQADGLVFFCSILDRFHMVALFLLAGMAIFYSLQKRSREVFLKERFIKLFIPLLAGSLLLNPVMTYIWFINQGEKEGFLRHYIGFFTRNPGALDGLTGGYTPAHLWFLLYLLVFSIIGLPLYSWFLSDKAGRLSEGLAVFFGKPYRLLLLTIPYCLFYLIEILDEKNPVAYFYIVLLGFLFASKDSYMKALCRDKWFYFGLTLLLFIIFFTCEPSDGAGAVSYYLYGFIVKLAKIVPAFMLMAFFREYMNRNSKLLSYLAKSCFTIYIIHMPVVTAVGYLVIQLDMNPYQKYFIIIILSYLLAFGFYEAVKRNRLLSLLFGANTFRKVNG